MMVFFRPLKLSSSCSSGRGYFTIRSYRHSYIEHSHGIASLSLLRPPQNSTLLRLLFQSPRRHHSSSPFPWRSSHQPLLPRLLSGDDLSDQPQRPLDKIARKVVAGRELGHTWTDLFLSLIGISRWQDELAQDLQWAFQKGVVGVLGHQWKVPRHLIDKEEDGIEIDTAKIRQEALSSKKSGSAAENKTDDEDKTQPQEEESTVVTEDESRNEGTTTTTTSSSETDSSEDPHHPDWSDALSLQIKDYILLNLEETLASKYLDNQPSDNSDSPPDIPSLFDIHLRLRPVSVQFRSAFVVPLLTRSMARQNPALRTKHRELRRAVEDRTAAVREINAMVKALEKEQPPARSGPQGSVRTVVVEIGVLCKETFWIRDRESGEIVEGAEVKEEDGEEKYAFHLVRFEMETTGMERNSGNNNGSGSGRVIGNWKIADWDDLLDGNVFY